MLWTLALFLLVKRIRFLPAKVFMLRIWVGFVIIPFQVPASVLNATFG